MPYSVSMPMTLANRHRALVLLGAATGRRRTAVLPGPTGTGRRSPARPADPRLRGASPSRVRTYTIRSPFFPEMRAQSSGLVVFGQVLVLLELVADGHLEVVEGQALLALGQEPLDGHLLGPPDDVLDHGTGVEVLEVQDLLVPGRVGDLEELVLLAGPRTSGPPSRRSSGGSPCRGPVPSISELVGDRHAGRQVLGQDLLGRRASGRSILIFTSSRPGRRMAGSIMSSRFEAPMTMTFDRDSTPSISESSWGTIVFSTSEEMPAPAGPEQRVHLVEEHDHREPLRGLLLRPLEDQPDLPLRLTDVLVQELGPLDVQEVGVRVACAPVFSATCWASELATALAMRVLPHPGGPYSSTPLGGCSCAPRTAPRTGTAARPRRGCPRSDRPGPRCPRRRRRGSPRGRPPRPLPWEAARARGPTGRRTAPESPARTWPRTGSAVSRATTSSSPRPTSMARSSPSSLLDRQRPRRRCRPRGRPPRSGPRSG